MAEIDRQGSTKGIVCVLLVLAAADFFHGRGWCDQKGSHAEAGKNTAAVLAKHADACRYDVKIKNLAAYIFIYPR